MGMNKTEIIAVTFAVLVVFCGLGAGIGGLIVEEANGNYVQGLADKTGTEIVKLTANDGSGVVAFRTADGIYIDLLSMINAYNGLSEIVVVYNVNNGQITGEQNAAISFNHAAGLLSSPAGALLFNLAEAGQN